MGMRFLDTQIVSYAFKGTSSVSVADGCISSVVANEFLEAHSKITTTSAIYYIPTHWRYGEQVGHLGPPMSGVRRRGFSRRSTDRLTLYFGQDYPTVVEYGSVAVSRVINEKALQVLRRAIAPLDRRKQRRLMQRFEFLCDQRVTSVPLQPAAAQLGQTLLHRFSQKYNLKKNFRNSLNDILIVAAAIHGGGELLTRDSVLVRFCADAGLFETHGQDEWIRCESTRSAVGRRGTSRESRAYVNRGWLVRLRRGPVSGA